MGKPLRVALALVLLAATGGFTASAQVRMRRDRVAPAPTGRTTPLSRPPVVQTSPRVESRERTKVVAVPRPFDGRCMPCRLNLGLGFGSFGGFPLWWWDSEPAYTEPPIVTLPADAPRGGVQLDVEPRRAEVYVDGTYAGVVSDFSGYYQHLEVAAGPHVITIVAPDYDPLILDVIVSPGRTATYRASLMRAYGR